jgi:integrase
MSKFTDPYIKNLKPQENRFEIREGDGFGIRVTPRGVKTFFYIYQVNGYKRRMTLGTYPYITLKIAHQLHAEAKSLAVQGIDPAEKRDKEKRRKREQREEYLRKPTIAVLAYEYIERHAKPNKRTWEQDRYLLNKEIVPNWGKKKASEITRRDVTLLLDRIKDRGAAIYANRTLALVRKMFNFAIQRDILNQNPCAGISRPSQERVRERVLNQDEIRKLWTALSPGNPDFYATSPTRLALRLQLLTACRIGEIMGAQWNEFDTETGWWEIPASRMKNKRPHRIWLTGVALDIMIQLKELSGQSIWVFPSPMVQGEHLLPSATNRAIRRSLRHFAPDDYTPPPSKAELYRLDIAPFSSHDLRRSAATGLGELGILPHIVGKVLSHVDGTVTGRHYDKFSYDQEKRKALEAWARHLRTIIEGKAEQTVVSLPVPRR